MEKYFILYKTTNKVNGRFYIGIHVTSKVEDGYLGSGRRLRAEIKKYGKENFERTILEFCNSTQELKIREQQIVTANLRKDPLNLNLKNGGEGGWEYVNSSGANIRNDFARDAAYREKMSVSKRGTVLSEHARQNISTAHWSKKNPEQHSQHMRKIAGQTKSEEHKKKIAAALRGRTFAFELVICPHCGKSGGKNAMFRYHFEKCKAVVV